MSLLELDITVLEYIRSFVAEGYLWRFLIMLFADSQVFLLALFLVGSWLWWVARKDQKIKLQALDIFFPVVFAFVFYILINQFFPLRPRPETVVAIAPLISHLPDNSFPSGHAIFAWATAVAVARLAPTWLRWVFWALSLLMPLARVAAGVHYPGDILVGYLLGALLALLFTCFFQPTKYYQKLTAFCIWVAKRVGL